jgi:putative iron-dependent peroxidase
LFPKDSITVLLEIYGFGSLDHRGIEGFTDGIKNPSSREFRIDVTLGDNGGSFIMLQKWVHKLDFWNGLSVEEQEDIIGRKITDELILTVHNSHAHRTHSKDGVNVVR